MENIILVVHIITALVIIALILLQQGKGAEMGASFGAGSSQTLFGASGSGNFFSRMTAIAATVFFVTSFSLAVIAKNQTSIDDDSDIPALEESREVPALDSDIPAFDDDVPSFDNDVPALENDIPEMQIEDGAVLDDDIPDSP